MVRSAAEQGGHDPELAEAMVRREAEYMVGTNVISKTGQSTKPKATIRTPQGMNKYRPELFWKNRR